MASVTGSDSKTGNEESEACLLYTSMKNYQADMQTAFDPTGAKPSNFQFYFGPNHFKTLLASNDLSFKDKDAVPSI